MEKLKKLAYDVITYDSFLHENGINWYLPKNPDPSIEQDWWSESHPQDRIVGEITSLEHTWILRVLTPASLSFFSA